MDALDVMKWNNLSLSEKAKIIKEAVDNGVFNLEDIKSAYNANVGSNVGSGHLFKGGGSKNSTNPLAQRALQFFIGKGLTPEQAAGLVGNLQRESDLNYKVVNPNGGATGLAQWLGDRKTNLFKRYGKNPTFDDQLDYIWHELNTTHKNGLRKLKEAKTVDEAAINAFGYYEFSAGPEAAIASMNSHGKNTKWKNGDGRTAMLRGVEYGRRLLGDASKVSSDVSFGASPDSVESTQPASPPQLLFASNPTDYGTPVDYSTPTRATAKEIVPSPIEEKQNGWEMLNLIQNLGSPQQTSQPLATYQPKTENQSPFVVAVPSTNNTMLDASWFADGGPTKGNYSDWKKAIAEHNDVHVDGDNTYDYEGYYNKYPAQAWAMLSDDPEAHFTDEFKTVNHPSFSNQSKYSGIVDARFNPEGIIGGNWSEDGKRYTLSEDQARHRWDIGNTMDYFGRAENSGVEGFYPDGRHWTTAEGDPWGGVLPMVTVTPKKARGGYLFDEGGIKTHSYSMDTPVEYNGVEYPGARMIVDGKEQSVFTDGTGTVWGLREDDSPYKVEYQHELPEVTVSPKPRDAVKDYFTESNDATAVADGRPLNPHLQERALKGAKAHAAWEEEHPNLAAWSYAAGAAPFAVAAAPLVVGAGDMAAGTALGQGVTRGLTGLVNMAQGSSWLPWAEWAAASGAATHGVNDIRQGVFTPETALEVAPLAGWAGGVARNLQPQSVRNWVYVSKAPVGYDGKKEALKYFTEGILSGRPADIENPWWYNGNTAKALQEYATRNLPANLQGKELDKYLLDEGQKALRARTDIWRMYNHIPQKYGTFTPSEMHPGAWTAEQDIRGLKYIPEQVAGDSQIDFVNSVGGNIGIPTIRKLGWGRTLADQYKEWGLTTTKDWWDLHPFSRPKDRIIHKYVQPAYRKFIGKPLEYLTGKEVKTPEFNFLKPLEEKVAGFEVGKLVGSDPVLVQYDIPWTLERRFVTDDAGNSTFLRTYTPGFKSEDVLPEVVKDWKSYYNAKYE